MTKDELQELGLPDIFLTVGDGTAPPLVRASLWPTREFLRVLPDLAKRFPPAAHYVPLWMLPASGVVAFDRQRGVYVRYYLGDPADQVIARDYQELAALIFLEFMETGLWDELDELAPLFRFERLDELKAFADEDNTDTADEALQAFLKTLE